MITCALVMMNMALAANPPAGRREGAEEAIRNAVRAYAEAYNRGDVDKLASFFVDDAEYVTSDGEMIKGRDKIRQELSDGLGEAGGGRLEVRVDSIELPRRNMAIVRGTATLRPKEGEPETTRFRATHVYRNERWPIRSVQEIDESVGEQLEPLAAFIGNWIDADEDMTINIRFEWTPDRHFITRSFTASSRDGFHLSGTEVIGWDPTSRSIRSWVFDSDGSFGQGVWSRRGSEWIIKARGVLPDGSRSSAVHIVNPRGPDEYTWESINREVDGEIQPNLGPFRIVRRSAPATAVSEAK